MVTSAVSKPGEFNTLLLQAIDETLNTLGKTVSQSIYRQLKEQYDLNPQDIPAKISEFQEGLEALFGSGARYIEVLIIQNLYVKTGLPAISEKAGTLEFIEYVELSRRRFKG
jgi:hypothetical protein